MNMCAAKSGTPSFINAGAAMTAQMMYDAVTGTASPTIHTISAVYTAVSSSFMSCSSLAVSAAPSIVHRFTSVCAPESA